MEGRLRLLAGVDRAPNRLREPPPWRIITHPMHMIRGLSKPFASSFTWRQTWGWKHEDIVTRVDYGVYFPHWFPASVLGVLAAAFGIRRVRFSLRTLLIGTTLVAVVLGAVVIATRSRLLDQPTIIHVLRITVSAVSGVLCVALIALWVRSYWWTDEISGSLPTSRLFQASSINGGLAIQVPDRWSKRYPWNHRSTSRMKRSAFRSSGEFRLVPYGIWLPHWFLVLTAGAGTGAPWIPWSSRFSLRTLLLATTLVALVLGLAVAFT